MSDTSYKMVKTDRKIILIGKNGQTEAQLIDLCLTEAGVISQRGAKEGTQLELVFEIPALEDFITLHIKATVSHRHNSKDSIYLKLTFNSLSSIDKAALSDFLGYRQRLIEMGKKTRVR
jgi:hypothetical protein